MVSLLEPLKPAQWDEKKARHLLNRAGFGTPRDRAHVLADAGFEAALDSMLNYEQFPYPAIQPDYVLPADAQRKEFRAWRGLPAEERQRLQAEFRRKERENIAALAAWWFQRMAESPRPLEEKLTLLWHGHFAVSAQKVQSSGAMFQYYDLLRTHAAGNLKQLTIAVGQSHAMLRYLDNAQSTKEHPNENWARELLELFTMGVGHYTEDDIKNCARAFTGWSTDGQRFVFRRAAHDAGEKAFLGKRGRFTGSDIIDIIFEQPVTAEHFARTLWAYFAYENPEPELVQGLAAVLRTYDYELTPALRHMFASRAFYSERAMGAQVKSPVQLTIELAHDLRLVPPPYQAMARASASLGQRVFYPPNVKGWDGNRAWINANSLLQRYNLPLVLAAAPGEAPAPAMTASMEPQMTPAMTESPEGQPETRQDRIRRLLETLPAAEQAAWRKRIREADTPQMRRRLLADLERRLRDESPLRPERLLEGLRFETAGACVDALTARFLNVPLSRDQRAVLLEALGARHADAPLTPETIDRAALYAVLHLLFSTAEYQLC